MTDSVTGFENLAAVSIFFIIPFVLAVILPALIVPFIVVFETVKDSVSFFLIHMLFAFALTVLALLGNLFWNTLLFNRVYYEWDRIFLPYTFFSHEAPLLDGSGTWIAPGWTLVHLYLLWFFLTLGIYFLSGIISLILTKKLHNQVYQKFILQSIIALTIVSLVMSLVVPNLIIGILHIFFG